MEVRDRAIVVEITTINGSREARTPPCLREKLLGSSWLGRHQAEENERDDRR